MSAIRKFRKEKDDFFVRHPDSPLTHEQRHGFSGLKYFSENKDLIFEVSVEQFPIKDFIQLQTSTGKVQSHQRFGKFKFTVGKKESELTIYLGSDDFFLPFVDSLAGRETYGAGRYLEPQLLENSHFLIDFNYAYNPYCAYNDLWSCPIPPAENRLQVPIKAGEKMYKKH